MICIHRMDDKEESMKKLSMLVAAFVLSGCAVDSTGLRPERLIRPDNLRTERILPMTFPEIQMALFKHESECGNAPVFKVKEGQTSYATITEHDVADQPWNEVIVFDLAWLQPTWRFDTRTRVFVYSIYSNSEVRQRIDAIFNAILKPEQCEPLEDSGEDVEA